MTSSARATSTPYLRLDPRTGWRAAGQPEGLIADEGGVRLGMAGKTPIADAEPFGSFGGRTLPTGLAISTQGRVYLADPDGRRILTYAPHDGERERPADADEIWPFRVLWAPRPLPAGPAPHDLPVPGRPPADPYTLLEPRDVALARNGDLVIADAGGATGFGRLIVLAMPSGALRHVIDIPGGAPSAVGFDGAGRAYVADPARYRIHRFDALWRWDEAYLGGFGVLAEPRHLNVVAAARPAGCGVPAVGCRDGTGDNGQDGSVFVVDRGKVRALDPSGHEAAGLSLDDAGSLSPPPLTLDQDGALSFRDPPDGPRDPLHLPGVAVTRSGTLEGTALPLLARPRRIVIPRTGVFVSEALVGDREGFAWDRLALESAIPEPTRLVVQTYTADDALEPSRIAALGPQDWSTPVALTGDDAPELLIQSPGGRRLWLRVEFLGDGEATPTIWGVDVHGLRRSSLSLLPAPFHQDPEGVQFLDRFLGFSDTQFAELTAINREIVAYLDPYAVPAGEFLDWLGAWFDWRFLADWPEAVRREMIATSVIFFRERGTAAGLKRMLRWHTGLADPLPVIIEHHRLRGRDPEPPLHIGGVPLTPAPEALAHRFTVVMPAAAAPDARSRAKIETLIEAQKPAHAVFALRFTEAGVHIGRQSSLGVDAVLGGYPTGPLGEGRLGQGLQTSRGGDPALGATLLN